MDERKLTPKQKKYVAEMQMECDLRGTAEHCVLTEAKVKAEKRKKRLFPRQQRVYARRDPM